MALSLDRYHTNYTHSKWLKLQLKLLDRVQSAATAHTSPYFSSNLYFLKFKFHLLSYFA